MKKEGHGDMNDISVKKKDSTKEFDGIAGVYAKGRPAYSAEFIDDLFGKLGMTINSKVADIGSGTGKFAEQIIKMGAFVYCVEPNDDMRNQAIKDLEKYDNKMCIAGGAENTNLQEKSVDYITTAQAFHWFDVDLFKAECGRIIKPNGKVFLIWNLRDMDSKMTQKCYDIYNKYCPKFKGFAGGIQKDDIRIKQFFDGQYEYIEYDNPLFYDEEKFISRSLSGSYSLKSGEEGFDEYITALKELFNEYAVDGMVSMPNKTVVYFGSMNE